MKPIISSTKLKQYLADLKQTLCTIDFECLNNVVFFNSHSFYLYLTKIYCSNGKTIGYILNQIEDCIPFAITDNSFSLFLSASNQDESDKMDALRKGFVESCKTDFLILALKLCNSSEWDGLVASCEDLRQKTRFEKPIIY